MVRILPGEQILFMSEKKYSGTIKLLINGSVQTFRKYRTIKERKQILQAWAEIDYFRPSGLDSYADIRIIEIQIKPDNQ
jgi:hypothetical protein